MEKEENIGMTLMDNILKTPFVKVNREEFLMKTFGDKTYEIETLINDGPGSLFTIVELDNIADKHINRIVLESSSLSFVAGIPGFTAMVVTIPADIAQFWAFALRLAQEISYIYGYSSVLDDKEEFTEEGKNTLVLFLGIMLGVSATGATVRALSAGMSQQLLKTIPKKALMSSFYYPIIKKTMKLFGIAITKKSFAVGVTKVIPLISGGVSGGLNYVMLKSQGKKLKHELRKLIDYTEEDFNNDIILMENEFEDEEVVEVKGNSKVDEINRLYELFEKGILTEEEFIQLKKEIINS